MGTPTMYKFASVLAVAPVFGIIPNHQNLVIPVGADVDCLPPDEAIYDHRFWYMEREGTAGVWYTKITDSLDYDEAMVACQNLGYGLQPASIYSEQEMEMTSGIVSGGITWIGLHRNMDEWDTEADTDWKDSSKWTWFDSGVPATYTNWATNMPNNNSPPENFTVQNWYGNGSGLWDDYPCSFHFPVVCQLECSTE